MSDSTPLGPRKVVGKVVSRPQRTAAVQTYIPEIAKGLAITMSHFFKNTKEMALGQRNDPSIESAEAEESEASERERDRNDDAARKVPLSHRALPLIELLRAAAARQVDVMWDS